MAKRNTRVYHYFMDYDLGDAWELLGTYESITEASNRLGIARSTISYHLHKYGELGFSDDEMSHKLKLNGMSTAPKVVHTPKEKSWWQKLKSWFGC